MHDSILTLVNSLAGNLNHIWTFLLFVSRFGGLLTLLPGIGMGMQGLIVRTPAILMFAFASTAASTKLPLPNSIFDMLLLLTSEYFMGLLLGLLPMLIITGVQTAGTLAATSMGLQASNLIDPTLQTQTPDIARIYGDLTVLFMLFVGGQYVLIYAASGYGGMLPVGFIFDNDAIVDLLTTRSADIFSMAVMISAPVVVALLLTNLVMGLITKAVPTVNVFIVSFPLTIGIGLALSLLLLPELLPYVSKHFGLLEDSVGAIIGAGDSQS